MSIGEQVWKVTNEGPQLHEIEFVRLDDGVTFNQFMRSLGTRTAPADPLPFTSVGGVQALETGGAGWFIANLEPGIYAIICHIPDPVSGKPHFALGMVRQLTVSEYPM
jgi:hypothetical protein